MRPLYFENGVLRLIDQTKLPEETIWREYSLMIRLLKQLKI